MDLRRISPSNEKKLQQLWERPWTRIFRPATWEANLITELGNSGEIGLLPAILEFAVHPKRAIAIAGRRAVANLLSQVPRESLAKLDIWIREKLCGWSHFDSPWMSLSPREIQSFVGEENAAVLRLASMHPNGRVREASLRMLANRDREEDVPFILLRLNDWVKQINEYSRNLVAAIIRPDRAPELLECLPIVIQLQGRKRSEHAWVRDALNALLIKKECESVLRRGLSSANRDVRLVCLQFAIAGGISGLDSALDEASRDRDSMVRLFAAKQLLAVATRDSLTSLSSRLVKDRFMPVRRETLSTLQAREGNCELVRLALLDRHASIREFARFHLRSQIDVPQFYRDTIEAPSISPIDIAIRGLGETGNESDAEKLLGFLDHREIRVRRAAASAIGKLAGVRHQKVMIEALSDTSPGVSTEAQRSLKTVAQKLDPQPIVALMGHPALHVRRNAFRLINQRSKWEQLPWILMASRDRSETISRDAIFAIRTWLLRSNRSFATPSQDQLSRAKAELELSRQFLDPKLVKEIDGHLKQWAR